MRHSIVQFIPRSLSETKEEDKAAVEEEPPEEDKAVELAGEKTPQRAELVVSIYQRCCVQ